MAFVTQMQWVCNTCGKQQPAEKGADDDWLHVKWWRTNGQVYEIDICSPRCALQAEKVLTRTLSPAVPPHEG